MVMLLTPESALAAGPGDGGNSQVTIEAPALVSGDLWTESHGAYLVAIRDSRCWYPQGWYDDVVIVDDLGEIIGFDDTSIYYDLVHNQLDANPEWFGHHDAYSARSCLQNVFLTRGDCSTDDRLAVLATSGIRDARTGQVLQAGDFDLHDLGGLYCLVVITRDPLQELVEDQSLVPDPVRATFPQFTTLVGLDNSVWYDVAPGENRTTDGFGIAIPTAGADYNLTLQIWLAGIQIDIDGDGNLEYDQLCPGTDPGQLAACAGSELDPVYTFQYETRAFHPFTIRTVWAGLAVDETGQILNIAPGVLFNEFTFDWETVEVRSSLDD